MWGKHGENVYILQESFRPRRVTSVAGLHECTPIDGLLGTIFAALRLAKPSSRHRLHILWFLLVKGTFQQRNP